ncbi:MAG: hypothetical protein P8P83_00240 [Rickettsiaceae bacterium]|nr:hypothetical protein [Rickettsiaceae bacterium]
MNNNKLPDTEEQNNLLNQLVDRFKGKFSLTPIVGAEIEFYLHDIKNINLLESKIGHIIKKEKGADQYEVDLPPSQNLSDYAESIDRVRQKIIKSAQYLGGNADFRSKPFLDDYGSSMHIHLNFLEDSDVEKYAQILCHYLPEWRCCMAVEKGR